MTTQKAYLVLSIKDLWQLMRAAQASRKASKGKTTHCVVLDLEIIPDPNGKLQVFSPSVNASAKNILRSAKLQEENNAALDRVAEVG